MGAQSGKEVNEAGGVVVQKVRRGLRALTRDTSLRGCVVGFGLLYAWNFVGAADPGAYASAVATDDAFMVGLT